MSSQADKPCPICGRLFINLKSHITKSHSGHSTSEAKETQGTNFYHEFGSLTDHDRVLAIGRFLAIRRSSVTILRRIPKGARPTFLEELNNILTSIVDTNSLDSWFDLLIFPLAALHVPKKTEKVRNLTTWVKHNITNWRESGLSNIPDPRPPLKSTISTETLRARRTEAKLADGDVHGAVRLLTSDDVMAKMDSETFTALMEKHPPHPMPTHFPDAPSSSRPLNTVSPEEILNAVRSFNPGSAGGLDGLCPQVLKDILLDPTLEGHDRLVSSFKNFINLILNGEIPLLIRPMFLGAALIALSKKDGGVRPIAIGNVWRRLVAKIICGRIRPSLETFLSPHQLGVCVSGGAEIGAHAARIYLSARHTSQKVFLKLDFRNAFNELRRDDMLKVVLELCPEYYPYISQCYSRDCNLYFNEDIIPSQRGVQQGDPLGPALFAITIQSIVRSIRCEFNVWYLDDGTIADTPENVLRALRQIQEKATEVGLHLNFSKCELFILDSTNADEVDNIFNRFSNIAPGIKLLPPDYACLLGSPLTDVTMSDILNKKKSNLISFLGRLQLLTAHSAFYLLRASLAIPRLIYFLRCAPMWKKPELLTAYDCILKSGLESILNCNFSNQSWTQATLPVRFGGLGVRKTSDIAIPAFLSSYYHSLPRLITLLSPQMLQRDTLANEGTELWLNIFPNLIIPENNKISFQAAWDIPLIENTKMLLLQESTLPMTKARLLASSATESGAWLNALPSPSLGLHLPNDSFRISVALRLGAEICQEHKCSCGSLVNNLGLHGLSCRRSAGRLSRHATINDIILRALSTAQIPSTLEPAGCLRDDGKRPDGLTLVPWSHGKSLLWDFTCVDTFASCHINNTSSSTGAAARKREEDKKRKYNRLLDNFCFVPVAIETAGPWGDAGLAFIKEIGRRISVITHDNRATSFLIQRISMALQRGNVASILGTLPERKLLEELFLL